MFFVFTVKLKKIIGFLGSKKIDFIKLDNFNLKIVDNENVNLYVSHLSLQSSFSLVYKNNEIFFLSDFDFFNKITKRVTKQNRGEDDLISEFSQLSFGDLIVHMDHGIGRFNGIRNSDVNGFTQDFIELIYHNNDKLLIPIENLELISRYGSNEKNVQLDKLGLQNWQNRKALIKNKIKDIAHELVKTMGQEKVNKSR